MVYPITVWTLVFFSSHPQEPVEWVKTRVINSLTKNSKWVKIRNSKLDFYSKIEKCEKLELLTHLKKLTNSELEFGFWLKLEFEILVEIILSKVRVFSLFTKSSPSQSLSFELFKNRISLKVRVFSDFEKSSSSLSSSFIF